MGTYLLNCGEQEAREAFNDWLLSQEDSIKLADPNVHAMPAETADSSRVLFSINFKLTKGLRLICITGIVVGLIYYETILLFIPYLGKRIWGMASQADFFVLLLLLFFLALAIGFSAFLPVFILHYFKSTFEKKEHALQQYMRDRHQPLIQMQSLAPPQNWVLFPRDTLLVEACLAGLLLVHLFNWFATWFDLWQIVSLVLPYLLLIALLGIVMGARQSIYRRVLHVRHTNTYRRLELIRLAGRVSYFFLFPLLFYFIISLLQEVSFTLVLKLPVSPPIISGNTITAFSNATITQVGHPGVNGEGEVTSKVVSLFFPHIIPGSLVGLIVIFCAFYIFVWATLFRIEGWGIADIDPLSASARIVRNTSSKLANVLTLLEWGLLFTINIVGMAFIGFGILWMLNLLPQWLPVVDWVGDRAWPFVWYQISIESLVGDRVGSIAALLFLLMIFIPGFLWFLMWIYSLVNSCWQSFTFLIFPARHKYSVKPIVDELCKQLHIASPIVRVEEDLDRPVTVPLLPTARFCVIRVPAAWVKELSSNQLRVVLAHEMIHVAKHAAKLWWVQLLSRLSIIGPGYLSLLLDYQKMELEADKEAVGITGDQRALEEVVEMLGKGWSPSGGSTSSKQTKYRLGIAPLEWVKTVYKFYFSPYSALVGRAEPSLNERLLSLGNGHAAFTEDAWRVIRLAEKESLRYQHRNTGPGHLLLGLLLEKEGGAAQALRTLGVELQAARDIAESLSSHEDRQGAGGVTLAPETKKVVELAVGEAGRLKHDAVDTEHLLLGLLREDGNITTRVLEGLKVNREEAREQTLRILAMNGAIGKEQKTKGLAGWRARYSSLAQSTTPLIFLNYSVLLGGQYTNKHSVKALVRQGAQLVLEKRYTEALDPLNRAIAIDGQNVVALKLRGFVHTIIDRYTEALADFDQVIALDGQSIDALKMRGLVNVSLDRYAEALVDLDRAISLDGKDVEVIEGRGQAYMQLDRYAEALADFDQAISLDAQNAEAIANRGETYRLMVRYAEALEDFDRAIALDERFAWVIASRGQVYKQLGRYSEALADFDRAIALEEKAPWIAAEREETYRLMKRSSEVKMPGEQLTEQARKVLALAGEEAASFQHNYIGTEHLLLGLLRCTGSEAEQVLERFGIKIEKVRSAVDFIIGRGERLSSSPPSLTQRGNKVIQLAREEAESLDTSFIGAEHILLGILKEGEGIAAGILQAFEVDLEKLREATLAAMQQRPVVIPQPQAVQVIDDPLQATSQPSEEEPMTNSLDNILDAENYGGILTEQARRAIAYAMEEAKNWQHYYIGTEHLLLGLLRCSDSVVEQVLKQFGIKIAKVRSAVEYIIGRGDKPSPPTHTLSLTPRGEKVIQLASEEARSAGSSFVDAGHILIGLVKEGEGIAAGVLESLGVNLEKVREATLAAMQQVLTQTQAAQTVEEALQGTFQPAEEEPIANLQNSMLDEENFGTSVPSTILDRENLGSLFTEQAKRVIELAEEEAHVAQHSSISTGHLLLGLVRESEGSAAKVLGELGVELSRVRGEVAFVMGSGGYAVPSEIGFAERTKGVIERAVEIANASGQLADTEHLLLALAEEERGISVSVFKRLGVHQQRLRERVLQEVGQSSK